MKKNSSNSSTQKYASHHCFSRKKSDVIDMFCAKPGPSGLTHLPPVGYSNFPHLPTSTIAWVPRLLKQPKDLDKISQEIIFGYISSLISAQSCTTNNAE